MDDESTDSDSVTAAKTAGSVGIWGWLGAQPGLLTLYLDRKESCGTHSILPLLGIASRVVVLQLGWLQDIKFKVVLRGVIGGERERVDGRKLAICTWSFPKNDWKAETHFRPSRMTPSVMG